MGMVTDDPDWAPGLYESRVLALAFLRRYSRTPFPGTAEPSCRAEKDGVVVTLHRQHGSVVLTIDATQKSTELIERVLTIEYESSNAWRIMVDAYRPGRWQRHLKTMVHPRPWLERCRAFVSFTGTLPRMPVNIADAMGAARGSTDRLPISE
jgi:hypothetical protein